MTGPRSNRGSRLGRAARALGTVLCLAAIAAPAARAQTSFLPRLSASAVYTDNIDLAPDDARQEDYIGVLQPGLYFDHTSLRLHTGLDYDLQLLRFAHTQSGTSVFHHGTFDSELSVLPDWLRLSLNATREQSSTTPTAATNTNSLFPTGNVANRTFGGATLDLAHKFRLVRFDLRYTQAFVKNQEVNLDAPNLQNSRDHDFSALLGSVEPNAKLTWDTQYTRSQTDYQQAQRYLYESATLDLGYRVAPDWRLLARGGAESDPRAGIGNGGLGATSYAGGFDWVPSIRDEIRALVGRRFYGTSYEGLWRHTSRMLELSASYLEQPTTEDNQYVAGNVGAAPPPPLGTIAPGNEVGPGNLVGPGAGAPGAIGTGGLSDFTRISSDVFLLKELTARATLKGRLTDIGLTLTSEERIYITYNGVPVTSGAVAPTDKTKGADLYVSRRFGPKIEASLDASYNAVSVLEGGTYHEQRYTATLTDRLGARSSLVLRLDHDQRLGGGQEFKVNIVSLSFQMGVNGRQNGAGGMPGGGGGAPGGFGQPGYIPPH
jgi:uncharacterized protein (PEP-CTERM system associated)